MIEQTWVELLTNFGFPVVVCFWFMFRSEKIIKANTSAINELVIAMKERRL